MRCSRARDFLFAPKAVCMGCGSVFGVTKNIFCGECEKTLNPLYLTEAYRTFRCRACGAILEGKACKRCKKRHSGGIYAYAPHAYAFPASGAVKRMKFQGVTSISGWMAEEISRCVIKSGEKFDLIVPVPIHFFRRLARGFNQSDFLARSLSEILKTPFCNAMKRIRYTRKQSNKRLEKRIIALKDAFRVNEDIKGRSILLVDDVITTGTTMIRCYEALMNAGAAKVSFAAFAISLPE